MPSFVPKPAIEKLPMAVRKDLRDTYENRKAEVETQIATLLGIDSFKSNINANEVWAYNTDDRASAGYVIYGYLDGFWDALKYTANKYGDAVKEHFNDAVIKHELVVVVNELGDKAPTIDCDIKDGSFRILFHHDRVGCNQSSLGDYIIKAIDGVPRIGLNVMGKWSVQEYWEPKYEELTQNLAAITGLDGLILDPNFDANFKALVATQEDDRWQDSFAEGVYQYFDEGLKCQLESQGFKGDEMLQEGLAEVATAKKIGLRVVEKTNKPNAYSEIAIENGEIWIQLTDKNWRVNTGQAGAGLVDML